MDNTNEDITKAHTAIDCLLMAYSAMLDYSFQGAPELRSATMEIIHALEEAITSGMVDVELGGGYDDDDMYKKEIVQEDGQFCVYSADRSRSFGCYISRERAEERLAQIEQFSRHIKSVTTTNLAEAYNKTSESLAGSVIGILDTLMLEELEKRLTASTTTSFTPIMKAEQRYTMGPVYVPELEDAHGETIAASELQTAIWDWVRKGDRTIYLQHSEKPAGEMVEILTWPMEIETSLVVPGEGVTKYQFPPDTPFMGVIWEEWAWELVKAGELRGYSIGGHAQRVEAELPEELTV